MEKTFKSFTTSGSALLVLAFAAFISLGLPDALLGMAWPSVRSEFSLPLDSLGILLASGVSGYLLSSFFAGAVMARLGVGKLLAYSCFATSIALAGFSVSPWAGMIVFVFVSGLGAGAIDAGINTYAAENFSGSHMQWLHASYGIGITMGPVIMTAAISYLHSWSYGYLIVSSFQFLLAICFSFTSPLWERNKKRNAAEGEKTITEYKTPVAETLKQYKVWISIIIFFVYTGIEGTMNSWAYSLLTQSRGISSEAAGYIVGAFFASFTVGRISGGFFTKRVKVSFLLFISLLSALTGTLLLLWNPFELMNFIAVVILGFSIAPVFPGMVSLTSERVGNKFAANTVGMQMSAAGLGMAVIPSTSGVLARQISLEVIPVFVAVCIIIVLVLHTISRGKTQSAKPQSA